MKKLAFLFLVAAVFGACKKDANITAETTSGVDIEFTATADFTAASADYNSVDGGGTKVALSGSDVAWSAGDAVALFDNHSTVNSKFSLLSTEGTSATFGGMIKTGGALADRVFYALYPYGAGTFAGTTCTLALPAEQSGNAADYLYMVADPLPFSDNPVTQDIALAFRQLMALVEVNVSNIPPAESIIKVRFTSVNPSVQPFALRATVDIAATPDGNPTVAPIEFSDHLQTKVVEPTGAASAKASLALFPVDFSAAPTDLRVVVTTSDGAQYYDYTVDKPNFGMNFSRRSRNTTAVALDAASRSLPYDMPNPTMEIADITLSAAAGPGNAATSLAGRASCVYVSSLMGLANRRMPQIYLDQNNSVYNRWRDEMISYGYTFTTTNLATLSTKFLTHDLVKGLVIVDDNCVNTPLAASLAGALDAVIVTEAMSGTAPYSGFPVLASASANTDAPIKIVTEQDLVNYIKADPSQFNLTGIVNYQSKSTDLNAQGVSVFNPWQMIDFAIKNKYPMCGLDVSSTSTTDGNSTLAQLFKLLAPNSPHFGWKVPGQNDADEFANVKFGAQNNAIYTVPCTNYMSTSLFSSKQIPLYFRNRPAADVSTMPTNVHYLTIVFSDGDNPAYYNNKFVDETWGATETPPTTYDNLYNGDYKYILNPLAGNVPFNYMYPPHLTDLFRPLHNFYQKNLPTNNYQICAISGMGYVPPHYMTTAQQGEHYRQTNQAMKECGLDYLVVIDDGTTSFNGSGTTVRSRFTDNMQYMPDVKGIFYMNSSGYSDYQGQCFFQNGVPVVSFRYCLWDGGINSTFKNPTSLATLLNAAPTDATKIEAYSAIVAHVNQPSYYDVDRIVHELLPKLDPDVVIVDADQFMKLIKQNVTNVSKY